jgi:putative transcriptional regulator
MDKLINFLKGRENKSEGSFAADFGAPKLARVGAFQGKLLLSTLKIQETIFAKSLVFVASHNDSGAMGLIVNRKLDGADSREVIEGLGTTYPKLQFKKPNIDLHHGGPMDEMRGFVLHSSDYRSGNTVAYPNGIAITSERQILADAVRNKGPKNIILAMGFSSWTRGQLEAEIEEGAWVVVPASAQLVFEEENQRKWQAAAEMNGINLHRIVPEASHRVS